MPHTPSLLARRFFADRSGVSAILFALAAIPVAGMVGAAVDYSRATAAEATLQRAADAAVIAGLARNPRATRAEQIAIAETVFADATAAMSGMGQIRARVFHTETGGLRIEVTGPLRNTMTGLIGLRSTDVGVFAEAAASAASLEVALVLDNTGSMRDDMDIMRQGAADLVESLMGNAPPGAVRVGVVPFVAAVNVGGAFPLAYMDTTARSEHHARSLERRTIASMVDCATPPRIDAGGGGGGGNGGGGGRGKERGGGGDRAFLDGVLDRAASIATTLFGIAPARADVTPRTSAPLSGRDVTVRPPDVQRPADAFLPEGFNHWQPCWLGNPSRISHFDLFDRIPNASWKGCVEARPEPFDVTDDPPNAADPNTLFVPYFWPDERDGRTPGPREFVNDYLPDGVLPRGWVFGGSWERRHSILKYDGVTRATIDEVAPTTMGPNAGCPTPVLPLTGERPRVLARIAEMRHWENGGTITSEGVMWGWRILSPGAPFTEGRPYGEADKVMVIMSDGVNALMRADEGGPTKSEYSAYGFLRDGRFATEEFADAQDHLDGRMVAACTNAKAAGVRIFALLYREDDAIARQLMRACASEESFFYHVVNHGDLVDAFRRIAGTITRVRLVR